MGRTLCIMPSGLPGVRNKPWAMVLRAHDLSGTDYQTLVCLDDETAREVIEAGRATWLYGAPDWDDRARKRALERACFLREEAEKIEMSNVAVLPVIRIER
jgi:hypothetical protein